MGESDGLPLQDTETRQVLERIDTGYKLTIKSTRGTGTRDQDKVNVEMEAETLGELVQHRSDLRDVCMNTMRELRAFDPDAEGEE